MTDLSTLLPRRAIPQPTPPLGRRILFVLLTVLLCVRPMLGEHFLAVDFSFLADLSQVTSGVTPATTLWIDALLLTLSVLVFWGGGRVTGGVRWVWIGLALLIVAVGLSLWGAGDRRQALNAGGNLLITVLAGLALYRTMTAPWMPRLVLAALLATGVTCAGKTLLSRYVYHADTVAQWEQLKGNLVARGHAGDERLIEDYERRLKSQEFAGFAAHPNVTAAMLTTTLIPLLGIGLASVRSLRRGAGDIGALGILAAGTGAGLTLLALSATGSLGGYLALTAGTMLLLLGALAPRGWHQRAAPAALALALYAAGVLGLFALGASEGTLPHPSLAFRWDYWSAGWAGYTDAPLTGVGRENFGAVFLEHRPPRSTEEVRNAHNLWVTALVELGPLGLLAIALLVVSSVVGVWCRGVDNTGRDPPAQWGLGWFPLSAIALGVLGLLFVLGDVPKRGAPLGNLAATWFVWLFETAAVWLAAFLLFALLLNAGVIGRAGRAVGSIFAATIVAALVHGIVGFAFYTPGGIAALATLAAVGGRWNQTADAAVSRWSPVRIPTRLVGVLVALLLGGGYAFVTAVPTTLAARYTGAVRQLMEQPGDTAVNAMNQASRLAVRADPLDPHVPLRVARAWLARAHAERLPAERRLALLDVAIEYGGRAANRRGAAHGSHRVLANAFDLKEQVALEALQPAEATAALEQAVVHWRQAVRTSPQDPQARIGAGQALFRWWRDTDALAVAAEALEQFERAAAIDEARDPNATARLSPADRELVDQHVVELRTALAAEPER